MKSILALTALSLLAGAAMAQDAGKQPLNLNLPPNYVPAPASTTAAATAPASSVVDTGSKNGKESVAVTPAHPKDPPGTYYGDTSGRLSGTDVADDGPHCDDATYNQPQMHGSVTTGVVSASHGGSGSYQGGAVSLSQAFGSCEHPTGGVSISVGGATGHFHR
ncbi:hypothetical protein FIV34_03955 [Luteibacter pinisoli]|uniref:Uncharacterized protein n=1 Tax=Luteibacter pinisoli TaxID=2589080 RepID=A0A4Y5YZJ8_9GAMM|nr:hypothetical protein [Luteibacter pinisoli]QDE38412.1 hypothetical protein FIV34_03955 [Luteibacter pinisoli]